MRALLAVWLIAGGTAAALGILAKDLTHHLLNRLARVGDSIRPIEMDDECSTTDPSAGAR